MRPKPKSGGGWPAIAYTLKKARASGGIVRMLRALTTRNACKTCALGMGGQEGGMVNEAGRFPEVCKKSVQAMAADMQGRVRRGFFDQFGFAELSRFSARELETSGRLVEPLLAMPGDRGYRPIGWEEALDRTAGALRSASPDETFFYFSGRSSNEAGFLLQLVARLYGTNNVNNCSFFCHQASGVALTSVTGSGTATVTLDDVPGCDLFVLIGGNPASNHPRLMRSLVEMRRAGGRVVVINPLREIGLVNFRVPSDVRSLLFGSRIADEYVMPHIGGDVALLCGIARELLESHPGSIAREFLESHTSGWEACRAALEAARWDDLLAGSGVPREQIRRVAAMYAGSKRTIFAWTMGVTHHEHGVDNVRMIANFALMRAMVGREGMGLLPLRGHSNVQGMGSMGAVPELKGAFLSAIERKLGVSLPRSPGLDTLACVQRAGEGRVRAAVHLGGNLFGSCPDSAAARAALSRIGTTVFLSTTLNTGHVHGRGNASIILPVLARDEEPQPTTQESMFSFVRLSDGGRPRHEGPRAEVEVIASVARRVLGERHAADFETMERNASIRRLIADVVPGYGPIGSIDTTRQEFSVAGRALREARFPTPDGRARMHAVPMPRLKGGGDGELRLMTIRSEGQFNTVVYEEEDVYRGQERRDVILLNPEDMRSRGLRENETVSVVSRVGRMDGILARGAEIRAGNAAMYYPEANVLVPRDSDVESKTPAFKSVSVRLERVVRLAAAGRA